MRNATAVLIALLTTASGPARIITVDNDSPADFATIQAAIEDANDGDTVQIRPGRYTGPGNRDIDFLGKAITVTGTDPDDPNTVAQTIIDCNDAGRGFYFHHAEGRDSIVDGLTITKGLAGTGAGILCASGASPTIRNNIIRDNRIPFDDDGGAGIGCWLGASPLIVGNIIQNNHCEPGGGGGGIRCYEAGEPVITNNLICGNSASSGGGICVNFCSPVISDCTFIGNWAMSMAGALLADRDVTLTDCAFIDNRAPSGGGLYNYYCSPTLIGCYFAGNAAEYQGGAIFNTDGCISTLRGCLFCGNAAGEIGGAIYYHSYDGTYRPACTNCTFSGNRSPRGNALACTTHLWTGQESIHLANCILWDGGNEIWTDAAGTVSVVFSNIKDGWTGQGNIDVDPLFTDQGRWDPNGTSEDANDDFWGDGDYHLKSQAGRWDPNSETWVIDDVTSPCIDAGDPMSPIGPEPFPNGGIINMGAYGGAPQASRSYFNKPPCQTIVAGDINGDCAVDFNDFRLMALHWCEDNN